MLFNTTEYEQYDYDTNSGYLYRINFVTAGITSTVWELKSIDNYKRTKTANIGPNLTTWYFNTQNNNITPAPSDMLKARNR